MNNTGLTEKHLQIIRSIFQKYKAVTKVVLYGSRAKGNYKPGSDIDMTIFSNEEITFDELTNIFGDFDDSDLPFLVDLSLFSKLTNKNLIDHINRVGKIIYETGLQKETIMTTSPTLSIITINRNNAEGLRKTMQSVLSQEDLIDGQLEYIIIDGESNDGSVDVIKEFASNPEYSKIISYWVSEKDTGLYNALNKGISKAKGSLIGLMHSGDWYLPKAFDGVMKSHNQNQDAIIYGALKTVSNGKFESIWGNNADILPKQMIPHLSTFVPKSVYEKYGTFDESYKIAADYDLFLRFYTNKVPFVFLDKIICCFNLEGVSQTNRKVGEETNQIKRKYGYYIEPSRKQKIKNVIKKLIHW